ncbi:redox-sensitive bicupin YhaK (pirin superfamily) [Lysobacter niabensis]|uniref:Redox-sensitive bicupin YhaK (Pirin superfamily) n=1 Tax=Agrilutibacter niabensis TaxID=380628 RepID=A0ABU1VLM7_9GAMM|nr:pirin family protein [Lysobacter niabensis]MDR7098362.1 redox-sensitive bicupin YhaK (pirin superfamily) [Lysobacter niabensis]
MTALTAHMHRANRGSHFRAYRLDGSDPALLDPFLGIDHAWMSAPTFPPHPHAGFSAVTYLFLDSETGIANRDSLGSNTLIQPGGVHWTAAGRGVIHEENPALTGSTAHLLQIFVNLHQERQGAAPFALSLDPQEVPVVQRPGARVRVPFGNFGGVRSPLAPPTEVTLLDISLEAGAELALPLAAGQRALVMPIFGSAQVNGESFGLDDLSVPILPAATEATPHRLVAKSDGAKVAVFIGEPLRQPVLSNGPLSFASRESLTAAIAAYGRGDFGRL